MYALTCYRKEFSLGKLASLIQENLEEIQACTKICEKLE